MPPNQRRRIGFTPARKRTRRWSMPLRRCAGWKVAGALRHPDALTLIHPILNCPSPQDTIMSLEQFSHLLSSSTHNFATLPAELLLASEGNLQTFYAPFDHVNSGARVVLCGITPGLQQASRALDEARRWSPTSISGAIQDQFAAIRNTASSPLLAS